MTTVTKTGTAGKTKAWERVRNSLWSRIRRWMERYPEDLAYLEARGARGGVHPMSVLWACVSEVRLSDADHRRESPKAAAVAA